jgi:hypothetical protein
VRELVLVANGELQAINAGYLRTIVESLFVTKHIVRKGLRHEVEYRPANPSEAAVRALLRADQSDGGLLGRLPPLVVEEPQAAVEEKPQEVMSSPLPEVQAEFEAGRRTAARYADSAERTRLEAQRGAEVSARYAARQAAVDPSTRAQEPPVVEERKQCNRDADRHTNMTAVTATTAPARSPDAGDPTPPDPAKS